MTNQVTRPKHFNRWFSTSRFRAPQNVGLYEIDNCLDQNGELIANHKEHWLIRHLERDGAYIERTLDGTGLIILALGCGRRCPGERKNARYTPIGENWGAKELDSWRKLS